ncbi:MAG: hypothetical protein KC636_37615, partial [Myxococcales bacterium]|nr:hypothetical protein [Myxococcales bacterium]
MADVLSCYGPDLDALADSAGEVKPFDAVSWEAWFGERWRSFADVIGFRSQADQLIHTAIVTKGQFGSIKTVLANGLADWIEKQPAAANPNAATRAKLDKVRAQAIEGWRSSLPGIWIVTAQPDGVPGRGCVGDVRAFSSPNAATYYEDQRGQELTARGPCEWNQP